MARMIDVFLVCLLCFPPCYFALPELHIKKCMVNNFDHTVARKRLRRDDASDVELSVTTDPLNLQSYTYMTNITIGTPPQQQAVVIDTYNGDTWFLRSSLCTLLVNGTSEGSCYDRGFDPSLPSTSFVTVQPQPAFDVSYGDGSQFLGSFIKETIGIGNMLINNVQFGFAENSTDIPAGVAVSQLGLGYSNKTVSSDSYPNILEVLVNVGAINSRLYSLNLNGYSTSSGGSVLFGGVDSARYTGPLTTVNFVPRDNGTTYINLPVVNMTGVAWGEEGSFEAANSTSWPSSVCTACVDSRMPLGVLEYLLESVFTYVDRGTFECSCEHRNDPRTIRFYLETGSFDVSAGEFILPFTDSQGGGSYDCFLAMIGTDTNTYTLSAPILGAMYLVLDLDNGQLSFAQANVNSTDPPNVQTVAAGPSGIAAAVSVNMAPSNTFEISPMATIDQNNPASRVSVIPSTTSASAAPSASETSSTGNDDDSGSGPNIGAIAGGTVGGVVGFALIGGIVWLVVRKKQERKPAMREIDSHD